MSFIIISKSRPAIAGLKKQRITIEAQAHSAIDPLQLTIAGLTTPANAQPPLSTSLQLLKASKAGTAVQEAL